MNTATIASLATAGGTLILAVATFSSTRSANRAARISEKALRLNLRPVLVPTREHDDDELVIFGDQRRVRLDGSRAAVEVTNEAIYLAFGLRNVGPGMAMLVSWKVSPATLGVDDDHADLDEMTQQVRDLSVPGGDTGYWQGALRDPAEELFTSTRRAIEEEEPHHDRAVLHRPRRQPSNDQPIPADVPRRRQVVLRHVASLDALSRRTRRGCRCPCCSGAPCGVASCREGRRFHLLRCDPCSSRAWTSALPSPQPYWRMLWIRASALGRRRSLGSDHG